MQHSMGYQAKIPNFFYEEYGVSVSWLEPMLALIRGDIVV